MQKNSDKPDLNTDFTPPGTDRLSGLLSRFPMRITPAAPGSGNFGILADLDGTPDRAVLRPSDNVIGHAILTMDVDWGGTLNPLLKALPDRVELACAADPDAALLIGLLLSETRAARCGAPGAAARLCEVLLIRMMRAEIARGAAGPGLLSGLTHPLISRAIVAIHDDPGHPWRNADLAGVAGLSLSRFAELFGQIVGLTPMAYLRRWRLTLARAELEAGARVKSVARRLGYSSPEALSRAVRAEFGASPTRLHAA
jgi:AraC-like DNA-binding protein